MKDCDSFYVFEFWHLSSTFIYFVGVCKCFLAGRLTISDFIGLNF